MYDPLLLLFNPSRFVKSPSALENAALKVKLSQNIANFMLSPPCFIITEAFHLFLLFRGEDVTEFQPPPDYILMADCIYYEEVNETLHNPCPKIPWEG